MNDIFKVKTNSLISPILPIDILFFLIYEYHIIFEKLIFKIIT